MKRIYFIRLLEKKVSIGILILIDINIHVSNKIKKKNESDGITTLI